METPVPVAKLYYFNPNTYAEQYFVSAYSRDEAIAAVKKHIYDTIYARKYIYLRDEMAEIDRQKDLVEDLARLDHFVNEANWASDDHNSKTPCIEEYSIGHVIQTEIS